MTSVGKKSHTRKTINLSKKLNKSVKQKMNQKSQQGQKSQKEQKIIILTFLTFLNTVKLFHWKTFQYSIHKATDDLYSKLGDNIDKFVEVMLGKKNDHNRNNNINNNPVGFLRIDLSKIHSLPLHDFNHTSDFLDEVRKFKQFILSFDKNIFLMKMTMSNQDLFTIRDEILADLNQFLYLSTLS